MNYTWQCFRPIQTCNSSFTKVFTKKNRLFQYSGWSGGTVCFQLKEVIYFRELVYTGGDVYFCFTKRNQLMESFGSESNNTCWVESMNMMHLG